ncbi:DUF3993 domain-containing protein [Bacillus sp. 1NLA3E]|uniref:DUF3993 domain-containing protein n=1 Tax=Bacillus sp. 1NLA3E TaxID=666686 RepID=UPI000247EF44|nr:DUF3993 domain-containing protein [Bacillus sp. 1NLA3E]AGK52892.1 hypothetical protein B1NLA3E_05630 [Bacillus sp. 1NLA3E]
MSKYIRKAVFLATVLLLLPVHAYASGNFNDRAQALDFLQEAFKAQVKLSEKERNYLEIEKILTPYFSQEYMKMFLNENLVGTDGKYITLGSDFALYYIPFFKLTEKTKIVPYQHKMYVYEFFPSNEEGPVSYDSHYEGILLEQFNGRWKVSGTIYDKIPEQVINLGKQTQKETLSSEKKGHILPHFLFNRIIKKSSLDIFSQRLSIPLKNENDMNHQWENFGAPIDGSFTSSF